MSILSLTLYLTLTFIAVRAQTTSATCNKNETTAFLFNANDESPCLVWAKLQSLCLPSDRYINVPGLADRTWGYNPPGSDGGLCQCNVVAYALMAGCSWCQLGDTASWVSEERWQADCSAYNNTSVSFAQSVLPIPVYAFHPWSGSRWTASEALSAASGPSTLVPTAGTTTLFRSFPDSRPTPTSSSVTPPTTSAPSVEEEDGGGPFSGANGKAARWGPIVGGIVGGVLLLVLVILLFRHWRRKHRFDEATREGEPGGYGTRRNQGEPFGLPMHDSPDTPTTTASAGFLGLGKRQPAHTTGDTGKRDQSRVSQWSSNFFTNPRKAPQPDSATVSGARYKTTTQRLREKGRYSSSDESSIDVHLNNAPRTSGVSQGGWEKRDGRRDTFASQSTFDQSRKNSVQLPQSATIPSSARHPFDLSPGRDPATPDFVTAKTRRESQKTSPRKPVPFAPGLRESLRPDTWSDQSSVMTFATGKTGYTTGGTGGSLPSFSTSIKEIKNHRQALAARVAETEKKERERELGHTEQEQEDGTRAVKKEKRRTKSSKEKKSKSKSKSGKRGSKVIVSGEIGVDDQIKKKKSEKKTKSAIKQTSSIDIDPWNKKLSPITYPRQSYYTAHTSDLPDLVSKPLPTPPTSTLAPPVRQGSERRQDISMGFSLAPLSATSPYTRGSVIDHNAQNAGRILSDMVPSGQSTTWYSRGTAYPSKHTSMLTTSVPFRSEEGLAGNGDRATMDFTRPRPTPDSPHSPRSTLPSLYEPFTGAPRYDVPPLPPKRGMGGDLVSPLSKYPSRRMGNRI